MKFSITLVVASPSKSFVVIVMSSGRYLFRMAKGSWCDFVQFLYMRWIDVGTLWYRSPSLIPNLAIWIDLIRGVIADEMADRCGLLMCSPFCEVGLDVNSTT